MQLLDGVVYLSEQGVEHGSLTCSNILVSREGAVKIGSVRLLATDDLLADTI
jgi:serine/threonine protein kinase